MCIFDFVLPTRMTLDPVLCCLLAVDKRLYCSRCATLCDTKCRHEIHVCVTGLSVSIAVLKSRSE
jgi:hypothetical protein